MRSKLIAADLLRWAQIEKRGIVSDAPVFW